MTERRPDDDRSDEDRLDDLLALARDLRPAPSDALVARILGDAGDVASARPRATRPAPARRGWLAALGGWPALGTLAAAAVAGLWIGAAPPAGLPDLAGGLLGEDVSIALGVDDDPLSLLEG